MAEMIETAQAYLAAGLCVLPARRDQKRPTLTWKPYQKRLPTSAELSAWFANRPDAVCLLCGAVSHNLEGLDFDNGGELFSAWQDRIPAVLYEKLVVETTPSGGRHVLYRCETAICGNIKLAQRKSGDKIVTLIETRGEGGLVLCAPTAGYKIIQGDLCDLPLLTESERDVLLQAAWELNEYLPPVVDGTAASPPGAAPPGSTQRPGDDYNARGDLRELLEKHGWSCVKGGANEYWRRPGKTSGWSATLKDRVFYVFSSNAAPFEPNRAYAPFAVYTLLEHGGDYEQAARTLREHGYGSDTPVTGGVDLSGLCPSPVVSGKGPPDGRDEVVVMTDPGPLPVEMLRVPGFIGEVMDHCLATAPYPNPVMAFSGALTLQAFLAGRKVRDPGDNRPNIYLLGLAHSAAGKDWPRKVNTRIVHAVGLANCLGERFASGEGIQDALFITPSMLFQTDEIDGMLQSINKARDARHEAVMSTLLTMFSASNSVFPMRRKAGKDAPGVIDQPNLIIFGTAIPNHYYEALSERMLTNGFFARMIILEAGVRGAGQEPRICRLPPRVVATAKWWADYRPGTGNLKDWHPIPTIVAHTEEAKRLLIETRRRAEREYARAEAGSDPVATTVWGRVSEQVRKLALLYAVSENHLSPLIGRAAVEWASTFVMHQAHRMLFMAASHVAENPFQAECLKLLQKLRAAPGRELPHQVLLKRMKIKAKDFRDLIETLVQRGDVEAVQVQTSGRTGIVYRLVSGGEER